MRKKSSNGLGFLTLLCAFTQRNNQRDTFNFSSACSLISPTLKKSLSECWGGREYGVPGASRCMDSAVACHFGDNWSALRDHCLSTRDLSGALLSEEECGSIEQEKSLSLSSLHTVGRGPPILKSQRFSPDVLHRSHCLHLKSTSFDSTFSQVVFYTLFLHTKQTK